MADKKEAIPKEATRRYDRIEKLLEQTASEQRRNTKEIGRINASLDKTNASLDKTKEITAANAKQLGALSKKWGDMSEALTIGDVLSTLNYFKGIEVSSLHHNVEGSRNGQSWEIDGLAVGAKMVVVIEAKAKLTEGHISKFINNVLSKLVTLEPEYRGKKIYGAVGYLKATEEAIALAQKKGLLVVRSTYQSKEIINPPNFKLRDYHP